MSFTTTKDMRVSHSPPKTISVQPVSAPIPKTEEIQHVAWVEETIKSPSKREPVSSPSKQHH